jgi:hypothetical protein
MYIIMNINMNMNMNMNINMNITMRGHVEPKPIIFKVRLVL